MPLGPFQPPKPVDLGSRKTKSTARPRRNYPNPYLSNVSKPGVFRLSAASYPREQVIHGSATRRRQDLVRLVRTFFQTHNPSLWARPTRLIRVFHATAMTYRAYRAPFFHGQPGITPQMLSPLGGGPNSLK
jgi:hypothetical protein